MSYERVLLFDADKDLRDCLSEALTVEGFQPCVAGTYEDLHELLRADRLPAAIILDVPYPPELSLELLKKLRSDPGFKAVPVIVTTTASRAELPKGEPLVLQKPFELAVFVQALKLVVQGMAEHAADLLSQSRAR